MNDPPTALVGFGEAYGGLLCRLSMNDPPTALVGFGTGRAAASFVAEYERSPKRHTQTDLKSVLRRVRPTYFTGEPVTMCG